MKRVLITGGAGFIGYHLAKNLLENGYAIDLLDNFSRGLNDVFIIELIKEKSVRIINLDLCNSASIEEIEVDYNLIYHLAAIVGVKHVMQSPYDVLEKNVVLLRNAINIARKQKKLDRFVFFSTSEVYAGTLLNFGLKFPTQESVPIAITNINDKRTSYMLSKIYGESMCFNSDLPITIVRPHNFYGPRMGLSHVIPEIMQKIHDDKKGTVNVYSINHKRTFCFIDDAVEIIRLLSESKNTENEVYNVGNQNEEVRIESLVKNIIRIMGKDILINPMLGTLGSPERRCPSMLKTFGEISYQNKFSLEKGLKHTYRWYKENIFNGSQVSAI